MSFIKRLIYVTLLGSLACSCNDVVPGEWTYFVPDETPFIILPARNATLQSMLNSQYVPMLDDVSSSSVALIEKIDSTAANPLQLKSILLYPGTDQKLEPIWVMEAPDNFMYNMKEAYGQTYAQNRYFFLDIPILKMRTQQQRIFASQIDNLLLISESSLGIENAIRVYRGEHPGARLADIEFKPESFIMNTPALDEWILQQAKVSYYPYIQDSFDGTRAAILQVTRKDSTEGGGHRLSGTIPLSDQSASTLVKAISTQNKSIILDRYISFDAAAFGIFRLSPPSELPESFPDTTAVDSFFINNSDYYRNLANTLSSEFAMVMYAKSGFRSVNEHAFIRKLKNPQNFRSILNELTDKGLTERIEDVYFSRSYTLCRVIGSKICDFRNFYIKIVDDAVIISQRKGLVAMIVSDYRRRQVVSYEPFYRKINKNFPAQPSGIVIGGPQLLTYLKPFLKSNNYIGALTSNFDYIAISAKKEGATVAFNLFTYNIESEEQGYRENWIFSTGGAELSGQPIFADIGGSANKEVIFATKSGDVYALAADGSVVQKFSTGSDQPVGSPVAYDWYDTGQNVILIAAGNKIYGWDESGDLLPQFPFELNENITTSLIVADINDNGLPDVLVATANRRLHALNARGNPLFGWPVLTNAIIRSKPLVTYFQNRYSVIAFASNAVHAWNATGRSLPNFPQFINASFKGSPVILDESILGASANGNLYAFGNAEQFAEAVNADSRNSFSSDETEAINVSGSALAGTPLVTSILNETDEPKIVVMSTSGSIFVLNADGALQLTKSMGQSTAPNWVPVVTDLNSDGNSDVVALADYGRLYAWQLDSGARLNQLPTTALRHVTIGDLDGDGLMEIVAQTEEGVQSWTIN